MKHLYSVQLTEKYLQNPSAGLPFNVIATRNSKPLIFREQKESFWRRWVLPVGVTAGAALAVYLVFELRGR